MSDNRQWDGLSFDNVNFPYNKILHELSGEPRFVGGQNTFVTIGGKLVKRPGTLALTTTYTGRADRSVIVETLETPSKVFLLTSLYNSTTGYWEMWYQRLSSPLGTPTNMGSLRDINSSTRAHEIVISRGLAYIKGFPNTSSTEKLGTVVFDGSGSSPSVKFWGVLGPTEPAAIVGAITFTTEDLTDTETGVDVNDATVFPATPFYAQIDFETVQVTGIAGNTLTVVRGVLGTIAATHTSGAFVVYKNWIASAHQVTVNVGWAYTYAYVTSTGQVSNRAPLQTNYDKLPSLTGPFMDLIPQLTITGHADTTNVPTIMIFRTTDGGGTYYKLKEITNTGGTITFSDTYLETGTSGGTFLDPTPDKDLSTAEIAPSLTSNSPPPTVLDPSVVGVDTPIACSPMSYYAGRIWYGLGNVLFYSGQEEVSLGVPEECWPSGAKGNFFRFQYQVLNTAATSEALYVFTSQSIYQITGNNRETFNARPIFDNYGAPFGNPRSVVRFGDTIAFLTHDYRIVLINGDKIQSISDPLFNDIIDAIDAGGEIDLKYYANLEKEWLFIISHNDADPTLSRQWIYDLSKTRTDGKPFWFTPWTIQSTACFSNRTSETSSQRFIVFYVYETGSDTGLYAYLDTASATVEDTLPSGVSGYVMSALTHLMQVPAGNHVNELRRPGLNPTVYSIRYNRSLYVSDDDPVVNYYLDDFWSDPLEGFGTNPARRNFSKAYKTVEIPVNLVCQRIALNFSKPASDQFFQLQNFAIIWNPDSGA